jgi:hypothetical protein
MEQLTTSSDLTFEISIVFNNVYILLLLNYVLGKSSRTKTNLGLIFSPFFSLSHLWFLYNIWANGGNVRKTSVFLSVFKHKFESDRLRRRKVAAPSGKKQDQRHSLYFHVCMFFGWPGVTIFTQRRINIVQKQKHRITIINLRDCELT